MQHTSLKRTGSKACFIHKSVITDSDSNQKTNYMFTEMVMDIFLIVRGFISKFYIAVFYLGSGYSIYWQGLTF